MKEGHGLLSVFEAAADSVVAALVDYCYVCPPAVVTANTLSAVLGGVVVFHGSIMIHIHPMVDPCFDMFSLSLHIVCLLR